MNADMNHNDAKKFITEGYAIDRPDTLDQWVIWILELVHVEVWSKHQTLGTELSKLVAIDESFWQRGGVDKTMAPHSAVALREPTWIWAGVEVTADGKCGKSVFRVMKTKAEAANSR